MESWWLPGVKLPETWLLLVELELCVYESVPELSLGTREVVSPD